MPSPAQTRTFIRPLDESSGDPLGIAVVPHQLAVGLGEAAVLAEVAMEIEAAQRGFGQRLGLDEFRGTHRDPPWVSGYLPREFRPRL